MKHVHLDQKGEKMNTSKSTASKLTVGIDSKVKLSLLWLFVVFNMAYADILSLMESTSPIRKVMAGAPMPPGGLIAGAVLMESAIAMVILSWVLSYKVNRWVTIVVVALNMLAVVTGGHGLYYVFFAAIEITCMLLIIWFAWKRTNPEVKLQ
jgi:hypothetical protein